MGMAHSSRQLTMQCRRFNRSVQRLFPTPGYRRLPPVAHDFNRSTPGVYDANDQLISISDPAATINSTLDNLGRATSISNTIAGLTIVTLVSYPREELVGDNAVQQDCHALVCWSAQIDHSVKSSSSRSSSKTPRASSNFEGACAFSVERV